MVDIAVVDCDEQFARMEPVWDELVAASNEDNPFRRWLWMWTWWKHYGQGRRLALLIARDGAEVVGIAPLFIDVEPLYRTGRSLRLLGSLEVCSEYLGLILRQGSEAPVVTAMMEFLFGEWNTTWDMLRWTDLPAESAELPALEAFLQSRGLPYARRPGFSNFLVRFPDSWDQYLAGLPKERRAKLRRISRRFDQFRDVEFAVAKGPEQFTQFWNELGTLHNQHWEEVGQEGAFMDPQFEAFHTEVAHAYCGRGQLVLAALRVAGEPIASCYAIRQGNTIYAYQRGHQLSWRAFRPGHALQFHLFRQAIEQGVRTWDYLRGDYPHKRDWATDQRDTVVIEAPARRTLAVQRFHLEQTLRTAKRRWARVKDSCWPPARLAKTNS